MVFAWIEIESGVHRDTQQMSGVVHIGAGQILHSSAFEGQDALPNGGQSYRDLVMELIIAATHAERFDRYPCICASLFWCAALSHIRPLRPAAAGLITAASTAFAALAFRIEWDDRCGLSSSNLLSFGFHRRSDSRIVVDIILFITHRTPQPPMGLCLLTPNRARASHPPHRAGLVDVPPRPGRTIWRGS